MLSVLMGGSLGGFLIAEKFLYHLDIMQVHGPLMMFAAVLLLAGVQLVALGLLGELQVRHYYEPSKRVPYSVDRVVRAEVKSSQEKEQ
jgi:hypothetical protein